MAANEPLPGRPARTPLVRLRLVVWGLTALVGIGAGVALFALRSSGRPAALAPIRSGPDAVWASGASPAPDFRLTDENGKPVSLAAQRGRPVIVTFLDPLCTTFCPRESLVLNDALRRLPVAQRPAVLAVSVNPPVRKPATLRREARRLRWLPQWRWAVGTQRELAAVWRSYHIEVLPTKVDVTHTEAAYVVDARGDERALFLWPFRAADVGRVLTQLR